MKIQINLASEPFRRDRPVLVVSALVGIAMLVLLGLLISIAVMERGRFAETHHAIAQYQGQTRSLSLQQARLDGVLRKPENAEVLERSLFLNSLLYRKGISWSRIFFDLEKTIPYNVRVISIRPTVNAQNQITLDMTVGAESPEPVIDLLKSLESAPAFGSAYLHSSMPPSQTDPLYRYRVSVNYAQKL